MSQENVEVIRRLYAAVNHGDERTLDALNELDPEVEMQDYAGLPDATWHHGHDGAIQWTRKLWQSFGTFKVEPIEFLHANDGRVVVPTRFSAVGKRSGLGLTFEVAGVYTLRGRSITRLEIFTSKAGALEAVGLSE